MTSPLSRGHLAPAQLLTPADVAELLSVTEAWVRRRAAAHLIPCTRLGRQVRFTAEQVQQIVETAAQPVAQLPAYGLTRRSRRAG
ncbi:MAG: DNA-binding protein [Frankiales bacterium]|nr:DNA-binding protein [Frankiales bacterium]